MMLLMVFDEKLDKYGEVQAGHKRAAKQSES